MVNHSELKIGQQIKCGEQVMIITDLPDGLICAKNIDSDYECVYEPSMIDKV